MPNLPTAADVVIVGAGPTGLTLAAALTAAGREVALLDKVAEGANTSRAAVLHARTLEVLEELGVTAELVERGLIVPTFTIRERDRVLMTVPFGGLPTAHPYTLTLPQSSTEEILLKRLRALGGEVHRPYEVTGIAQDDDGVTVTTATGETVRARYAVGADGMHSVVRREAGIEFAGDDYPESFVLADVHLDWELPEPEVRLFLDAAGLVVVAPLPGGHHRVVATVDEAPEHPDVAYIQAILDERGPRAGRVRDASWTSRFRVHHRIADRYRAGRIVLAGDAAHVHSPAGGQGMNIGIQDAVELAHRIAAGGVDGYEETRRPVAAGVVTMTDRMTRAATVHSAFARTARNTLLAVAGHNDSVRRKLAMTLAELNVSR